MLWRGHRIKGAGLGVAVLAFASGCEPRGWGQPQLLTTVESGGTGSVRLVIDDLGNAVAVWEEVRDNGKETTIRARRFRVDRGWLAPETVGRVCAGCDVPRLGGDAAGDALAVWNAIESGSEHLVFSLSLAGSGWSVPEAVPGLAPSVAYDLAMAADGHALLVTLGAARADALQAVFVQDFARNRGWDRPQPLATILPGRMGSVPTVSLNDSGQAVVVWAEARPEGRRPMGFLRATRFAPGIGWTEAEEINGPSFFFEAAQPGIDSLGNVFVVGSEVGPPDSVVMSRRSPPGAPWEPAEVLEPSTDGRPGLSVGPEGQALVSLPARDHRLWIKLFLPGTGWQVSRPMSAGFLEGFDGHVGPAGVAAVVWTAREGSHRLWARRYEPTKGWTPTGHPVDRDDPPRLPCPPDQLDLHEFPAERIRVDRLGNAIAIWAEKDCDASTVWANRFQAADP